MVSNLTWSGCVVSYLIEDKGKTYTVKRGAYENLSFNNFTMHYQLQMINYSEHIDTGRSFSDNKSIGVKIYYPLISKEVYVSQTEQLKQTIEKVEGLTTTVNEVTNQLNESRRQNEESSRTMEVLIEEIRRLQATINQSNNNFK